MLISIIIPNYLYNKFNRTSFFFVYINYIYNCAPILIQNKGPIVIQDQGPRCLCT